MSEEEVVESTEEVVEEVVEEEAGPAEEQSFVDNMLSQIDNEDIKSAGFWQNLKGKDANELGQYVKELQSFAGRKGDIPKDDASAEEWNEFYSKLGRPESVEGYDFEINDDFLEIVGTDSAEYYNNVIDGFKEKALEVGATSEQAEEIVNWYLEKVAEDTTETSTEVDEQLESMDKELREAWGEGYDGMMSGVQALLKSHGMSDEDVEFATESGFLKDPSLAIALGNIAARFEDDVEIGHHQTNTMAGIRDQLFDVEQEVLEYIKTGKSIPQHIADKRISLMNKLGEDLR
tara:strand:+ start:13253 stop:14122 length:870 start_codon:yes stop_codon:yes gene_type:complete